MPIIKNPELKAKYFFIFFEKNLLLTCNTELLTKNDFIQILKTVSHSHIYLDTDTDSIFTEIYNTNDIANYKAIQIRESFCIFSREQTIAIARSKALINWLNQMQFCPSCATKLQLSHKLSCLCCSKCNKEYFPRIEPAIIVLVHKNNQILLARHRMRNQDIYTCIAGFVEAGETLEQAVHREVKEETGLTITNVTYKGSQAWPFPDQLMLAFYADYKEGEINIQKDELTEARWFDKDKLPNIPSQGSVAHNLIFNKF